MFSKLRARKAARKDKSSILEKGSSRWSIYQNNGHASSFIDYNSAIQPAPNGQHTAMISTQAPTLPPIPRIASQSGNQEPRSTNGLPATAEQSRNSSRVYLDGSMGKPNGLQSAMSLPLDSATDTLGAGLQANSRDLDTFLMPPPPRPGRPQLRAHTDVLLRPVSTRTEERSPSSQGSSIITEIPSPYRLHEPDDCIIASPDSEMPTQSHGRPKSRLTKLNPLSYLPRKKTPQSPVEGVDQLVLLKRASYTPAKDLPRDFDPRIKGKGVHDFSAPGPSRFGSVQNLRSTAHDDDLEAPPSGLYADQRRGSDSNLPRRLKDFSPERRYTPVFKEDFSESAEGWRLDPEDRRNRVSTNIVDKVAALEREEKEEKRRSSLPAFAQRMPQDIPSAAPDALLGTPPVVLATPKSPPQGALAMTPDSIQQTPDSLKPSRLTLPKEPVSPSPQDSPLSERSRATSPDAPTTLSSLPKHLRSKTASVKSQASRFSFDMAGGPQEKLLEERHRQRAARARATSFTGASINEEDDFNEDDIDFSGGLEEEIPGMSDDDFDFGKGGLGNMTLDMRIEEHEDYPGMDDADDDNDGLSGSDFRGGLANMTLESFKTPDVPTISLNCVPNDSGPKNNGSQAAPPSMLQGLARSKSHERYNTSAQPEVTPLDLEPDHIRDDLTDPGDGFYFDDGEIGNEDLGRGGNFDESVLDEEFERGKPLRPPEAERAATVTSSQPSTRPASLDSEAVAEHRHSGLTADTSRTSIQNMHGRRSSAYGQHTEQEGQVGLTRENLAAYHDALAFAANQAAVQGRFERKSSTADGLPLDSFIRPQAQRISFYDPLPGSSMSPVQRFAPNDNDAFDFDGDLDDDAIIAEANAEALENDEEGFYGQEFGFYARDGESGEAQFYHGGYFGPGGMNTVKRSHSGREAFQEPSLTPITERSEWSNRNSMINFAMHGNTAGGISPGGIGLTSPGLAQLADQMQHDNNPDDMSLSALMKARRGAFGGSSSSLHSMGGGSGSRSASPGLYNHSHSLSGPVGSTISPLGGPAHAVPPTLPEEGEQEHDQEWKARRPSSGGFQNPLLTLQTQNLVLRPTTSGSESSPLKRGSAGGGGRSGHSRQSSGAESVSYAMEKDEDGGNLWVLEKRRTLENGQMEVLGREVVKGTL